MKKLFLILAGLIIFLVVGHFDRPEDYSFPLSDKNRVEVTSRQQSFCVPVVAHNK